MYEILQGQDKMDQQGLEDQPHAHYPLSPKVENIMENASKGLCGGMGFTSDKKLNKNLRKLLKALMYLFCSFCHKNVTSTFYVQCSTAVILVIETA